MEIQDPTAPKSNLRKAVKTTESQNDKQNAQVPHFCKIRFLLSAICSSIPEARRNKNENNTRNEIMNKYKKSGGLYPPPFNLTKRPNQNLNIYT